MPLEKPSYERLKKQNEHLKKRIYELEQKEENIREVEETLRIISSRFVGVEDNNRTIHESLADMGRLSGASRAGLFLHKKEKNAMIITHEWFINEVCSIKDQIPDLRFEHLPWGTDQLYNNKMIYVADISNLPEKAKAEKELL